MKYDRFETKWIHNFSWAHGNMGQQSTCIFLAVAILFCNIIFFLSLSHFIRHCERCNYGQQLMLPNRLNIEKFVSSQYQSQSHYKNLVPMVSMCVCLCLSVSHTEFVWIMYNLLVNVRALNPFFAPSFNVAVHLRWERTTKAKGRTIFRTLHGTSERKIKIATKTIMTIRMVCLFELHSTKCSCCCCILLLVFLSLGLSQRW